MTIRLRGRLARPGRASPGDRCPIDRTMQVVGTRSAMLLMREASYGTTRFDDFAHRSGLTDAVTSARLRDLVGAGLLAKSRYQEPGQRSRHEYVLTESGRDLLPALVALATWGSRHLPYRGSPVFTHDGCDEPVAAETRCAAGHLVSLEALTVAG